MFWDHTKGTVLFINKYFTTLCKSLTVFLAFLKIGLSAILRNPVGFHRQPTLISTTVESLNIVPKTAFIIFMKNLYISRILCKSAKTFNYSIFLKVHIWYILYIVFTVFRLQLGPTYPICPTSILIFANGKPRKVSILGTVTLRISARALIEFLSLGWALVRGWALIRGKYFGALIQ